VVVSQSNLHDGSGDNLVILDYGAEVGGVHAEDRRLRRVDDGRAHHASKHASVAHSESPSTHVFGRDGTVFGLQPLVPDVLFNVCNILIVDVPNDGHLEPLWATDGHTHIDEAAVEDVVAVDHRVHNGLLLQSLRTGFEEESHEAQFDAVGLGELILEFGSDVDDVAHVDLVESCEQGVLVLRRL